MAKGNGIFTNDIGEPLTFSTEACVFRNKLGDIIRVHGGQVVKNCSGPHTVALVVTGSNRGSSGAPNTFSHTYIRDCLRRKRLLPLRDYWAHKDPSFDDRIDPNDVMLGLFTWTACKLQQGRQSPLHQPSYTPSEKVERDSQTPYLYLSSSPLPIQVMKGAVHLERKEFPDETKEVTTSNTSQTEGPHQDDRQSASPPYNLEEEKDPYDFTDSYCEGDKETGLLQTPDIPMLPGRQSLHRMFGKQRGLASPRYQGLLVQSSESSASPQSKETFPSSEDSVLSSRQKENPITSKYQRRDLTSSKEAEENQILPVAGVNTYSSSKTGKENFLLHERGKAHVYPPKRPGRGGVSSARNQEKLTQASSLCPWPSGSPSPSTSQRLHSNWLASPSPSSASSASTKTANSNDCPLFRSSHKLVSERNGKFMLWEDLLILKYVVKQQAFDRLRGEAFWREMEHDLGYSRTWQSLKERFRMRIVTHLDVYIPHGLDPDVIKLLKGELGIMKRPGRRAGRSEFNYDEDLIILHFISVNHRYGDVGGVVLWQEMQSKCNVLCHHTWSSIKNRFMKKILPNITTYGLTKEEVLQFQIKRRLREHERKQEGCHNMPRPRRKTAAVSASHSKEDHPSSYQNRPNKRPATKKSRPTEGDLNLPVTSPQESCQAPPESAVGSYHVAPFSRGSIDHTLTYRRKKRFSRDMDKVKKKQILSIVMGEEEEESSQDEPTTKTGLIVHRAEVHRERLEEDVTQKIMNTKQKHPLLTSTIEDEGEEEPEKAEEILLREEIIEETEEEKAVTALEKERTVAGELSQKDIASEEEELKVHIFINLPKHTQLGSEEKIRTPPTQHNSPSILHPDPPRKFKTVAHIHESSSGTSDTTLDVLSPPSRRQSPEHRRRDRHAPSSTCKIRNKLRKWIIRE